MLGHENIGIASDAVNRARGIHITTGINNRVVDFSSFIDATRNPGLSVMIGQDLAL